MARFDGDFQEEKKSVFQFDVGFAQGFSSCRGRLSLCFDLPSPIVEVLLIEWPRLANGNNDPSHKNQSIKQTMAEIRFHVESDIASRHHHLNMGVPISRQKSIFFTLSGTDALCRQWNLVSTKWFGHRCLVWGTNVPTQKLDGDTDVVCKNQNWFSGN